MREIIEPTMRGMAELGAPFSGVLFAGLMITDDGPEADRIQCPLRRSGMPGADDAAEGRSAGAAQRRRRRPAAHMSARWRDEAALTVVMAAKGYPGTPEKGSVIRGLDEAAGEGVEIFHAGTADAAAARSSPMAAACSTSPRSGKTVAEAQSRAYAAVDRIDWPEGFCRRDIGWRAVEREKAGRPAKTSVLAIQRRRGCADWVGSLREGGLEQSRPNDMRVRFQATYSAMPKRTRRGTVLTTGMRKAARNVWPARAEHRRPFPRPSAASPHRHR